MCVILHFFFLMLRRPPRSTRTDTLFPYTTLFRSKVAAANKAALREPSNAGFVGAVQVYPYSDGTLYRLYAAPERITDIALQPGEAVTSVAAGDTVRWTVGDTTSGSGAEQRTPVDRKSKRLNSRH